MSQRLNGGNHFNIEFFGVSVNLADFLHGIRAAHVTEIRFAGNLIRILGIDHRHIVAEQSQTPQPVFEMLDRDDVAAGAVKQNSVRLEENFFAAFLRGERICHAACRHCAGTVCHKPAVSAPGDPQYTGIFRFFEYEIYILRILPQRIFIRQSPQQFMKCDIRGLRIPGQNHHKSFLSIY